MFQTTNIYWEYLAISQRNSKMWHRCFVRDRFSQDHPIGSSKFSAIQLDLKVMARLTLNVVSMFV